MTPRRALVVEDSRTTRLLIRGLLAGLGFEVVEAADGVEGLARLRDPAHDGIVLALVDWHMPVLDGLGFVEAVRAEPAWAGIRLIMVTTEIDKVHVIRALEAGADEYLMKPFTDEMVREKLAILGLVTS